MDLKSGAPFWALRNGLMTAFAPLKQDIRCDVLIVGAGITGALIADRFSRAGLAVCVVDQREVAYGSTSASTALLQYEIDTELHALAERYGLADATLAYQSCVKAVYALHRLASSLRGLDAQPMQSLYLASHWYHRQRLLDEGALRQRQGLAVEVLKEDELRKRFGLSAPAALLSTDAAQIDPYQLTHALLRRVRRRGGGVHDHTRIAEFASHRRGVRATTAQGCRIEAGNLVMAAGYESARHLEQKLAKNRSSYAYITDALTGSLGPLDRVLIWESARHLAFENAVAFRVDAAHGMAAVLAPDVGNVLRDLHRRLPHGVVERSGDSLQAGDQRIDRSRPHHAILLDTISQEDERRPQTHRERPTERQTLAIGNALMRDAGESRERLGDQRLRALAMAAPVVAEFEHQRAFAGVDVGSARGCAHGVVSVGWVRCGCINVHARGA